jgi:hypothetical protein
MAAFPTLGLNDGLVAFVTCFFEVDFNIMQFTSIPPKRPLPFKMSANFSLLSCVLHATAVLSSVILSPC